MQYVRINFDFRRLLLSAATPKGSYEVRAIPVYVSRRDFVKVEKNLSTLGFFTPSKSRGKIELVEKTIRFKREVNGKTVEAEATILPSAKYGLPTTADLDKYLAFQKILNDIRVREGQVSNPIGFSSTQMLNVLGVKTAGNNYQEVYEWLQRMTLTGISSKGVIYLARRKAWATDTFHVFDRVVAFGMEMPDGSTAERNYVWLSDWQIENINNNYLMPIDFDTYRKLRNHIAKALVPLLQVWLYASRNEGDFEKRYQDLCSILDIRHQKHLSLIKKQLGPSLDELQYYGYLAGYRIEVTSDGRDYKIVADHGTKFFKDQKARAALPMLRNRDDLGYDAFDLKELDEPRFERRACAEVIAISAGGTMCPGPTGIWRLGDCKIEEGDCESTGILHLSTSRKRDSAGFFREFIQAAGPKLPSRKQRVQEERNRLQLEHEYKQFCEERVTIYVETEMNRGEYEERLKQKMQEVKSLAAPASAEYARNRRPGLTGGSIRDGGSAEL